MNPTIRTMPGHAYAPGFQPKGSSALETGVAQVWRVLVDLTDLALPFLMAVSGALLVWALIETLRARARARRRKGLIRPDRAVSTLVQDNAPQVSRRRPARADLCLATQTPPDRPAPHRARGRREPFTRESLS